MLSKSVQLDRTPFVICPVEECWLGTQFPNTLLEQMGIECRAPDSQLPITPPFAKTHCLYLCGSLVLHVREDVSVRGQSKRRAGMS
jgi:hypothetical protein